MKKIVFIAIAMFAFNFANAQSNVVKVNPLGMAFGIFNGTFEHALNEKTSVTVGLNYFNWKVINTSGLGGEVAYRFYFSKNNDAPEGIYAAPFAGINSLTYKWDHYNDDGSAIIHDKETAMFVTIGAQAGYQWIFDSGLALDLYFGYGYAVVGGFENYGAYAAGRPKLGVAVGYNF